MDTTNLPPQRHLSWQGCYNARDLGGLPTEDGRETRWSAVIRSDILGRLTDAGWNELIDYGVRTIIDLRGPQEAEKYPYDLGGNTAMSNNLTYLNLPLEKYYPHVSEMIKKAETRGEVYCIVLDQYPDMVATVMRAIANAEPGGVVIHCHAGKDRTGTVAALLLRLAGVSAELVAADYAESQERLWPLYEELVAEAGGEDKVGFWLKPTVTKEMMYKMLDHLDAQYRGVEGYLKTAGLSEREIRLLKQRL
ncbi:MAG: tyrosine-protein phosphatase [Candidatus Promineifilaceae bacterium]